MEGKSSLEIYRTCKLDIKEERFYDNRDSSKYISQVRTKTLPLYTKR